MYFREKMKLEKILGGILGVIYSGNYNMTERFFHYFELSGKN